MNELIYRVVYTPSNNSDARDGDLKYICSDNKIHIRLRDYDHEEVISGLIPKLTYILTYMINSYGSGQMFVDDKQILESFIQTETFIYLESLLKESFNYDGSFNINCSGIRLFNNYRKKSNYNKLGSFSKGTCLLTVDNKFESSVDELLRDMGIPDLHYFLFSDRFELHITKNNKTSSTKKYLAKTNKIKSKQFESKTIELW